MREITESQAQELANMLKLIIAGDKSKEVYAFAMHPDKCENAWIPCKAECDSDSWGCLPIRIISSRPWAEQIWRPKAK